MYGFPVMKVYVNLWCLYYVCHQWSTYAWMSFLPMVNQQSWTTECFTNSLHVLRNIFWWTSGKSFFSEHFENLMGCFVFDLQTFKRDISPKSDSNFIFRLPNPTNVRQFLTRFSTPDWFLTMLKTSTEHGSGVSMGSCVSETVNNIESITREVVLVIYHILS